MIIGIGSDIVSVKRIVELDKKYPKKFLERIFTPFEIDCSKDKINKYNYFAKRFAAKEAFSKAIGLGIGRGFNFNDIEVFNDDLGKPFLRILNSKKPLFNEKKINLELDEINIHLSLSDDSDFAHAFVVIEKK